MNQLNQAVILAAGKGIRLDRPDSPKPLVRIGHKPLLLWTIERLAAAGVREIWIVAGQYAAAYQKELLAAEVRGVVIRYLETATGGEDMLRSILTLPEEISGPYILTVADLISENNPYELLTIGTPPTEGETLCVVGTDAATNARSGAHVRVRLDGDSVCAVGAELADYQGLEVGVYAVGSAGGRLFAALAAAHPEVATFEQATANLAAASRVGARRLGGEWYDVNTPATAVRAEMLVRRVFFAAPSPSGAVPEAAPSLRDVGLRPATVAPLRLAVDASFSRVKKFATDITIRRGLLGELGRLEVIEPSRRYSPHFLLTDSTVDGLYGEKVSEQLGAAGVNLTKLVMPAGEHAKNIDTYTELVERILAQGMDEGSVIFSLGGGVVNNMAGFLAATLYRGVGLVHLPTTTMAQVDAAIDFKQGVNTKKGKNLTGAYHPASHILIDPETIRTLSPRHVRNGLAESLKHAITRDANFFQTLMDYAGDPRDLDFLEAVIRRTIALKVPLLCGDPGEEINEMEPQYGHSVGHAVEHLSGYSLLHGEAVAIGMCVTAEVARLLGVSDDSTVEAHYRLCQRHGLPTTVPAYLSAEDVLDTIRYDKHYLGGLPRLGLVSAVGKMFEDRGTVGIPIDYSILSRAIAMNQARQGH